MKYLKPIEAILVRLSDNLPGISSSIKKSVISVMTAVVIIVAVIQIFTAFSIHDSAKSVEIIATQLDYRNSELAVPDNTGFNLVVWSAILLLISSAALLLRSYPDVEANKKAGWDFVLVATLINAAYVAVIMIFDEPAFGRFSVWTLIGSLIGAYLLLQIRENYTE